MAAWLGAIAEVYGSALSAEQRWLRTLDPEARSRVLAERRERRRQWMLEGEPEVVAARAAIDDQGLVEEYAERLLEEARSLAESR